MIVYVVFTQGVKREEDGMHKIQTEVIMGVNTAVMCMKRDGFSQSVAYIN